MLHAKEARTLGTQYEPPNELVQCMKKIRVTASRGVNFKCFNYELSEITLTKLTEFGYKCKVYEDHNKGCQEMRVDECVCHIYNECEYCCDDRACKGNEDGGYYECTCHEKSDGVDCGCKAAFAQDREMWTDVSW